MSTKDNSSQQNNTPVGQITSKKAVASESVWKAIFFFIITASSFLLYKVYLYQTNQKLLSIRKGSLKDLIIYGIPICIVYIIGQLILHAFFDKKVQSQFIDYSKWPDKQKRAKRCYMIVKWGWNVIYYIWSIVVGYLIIKDTSYWPVWLGGNGECTQIGRYVNTFEQATLQMQILYIIHFGRHLGKLIQHTCMVPEGNFYQYALHHGLSAFLIFYSYLTNMWIIGLFVLFIHDASDILLIIARVIRDGKKINKLFSTIVQIGGAFLWFGCRIFLLSYCCINSGIRALYQFHTKAQKFDQQILDIVYLPVAFMTFMLIFLQVIQLFWTYFIIRTAINDKKSGKITKQSYD